MTAKWKVTNEAQEKQWKQKLDALELKMRQQDETIKKLEDKITAQIAQVIGDMLKSDSGVVTKAQVLKGQYDTTQELVTIKTQVAGMETAMTDIMKSIKSMNETMEKKLDNMTRDNQKRQKSDDYTNANKLQRQSLSRRAGHQ